jgi:RNA polymerase sigma-54 factor
MEPKLSQHQSQKLVLSPQIRQYLKLLQLPITELQQSIESELAENPVLEEKNDPNTDEPDSAADPAEAPEDPKPAEELQLGESFERFSEFEDNLEESANLPDLSSPDKVSLQKSKDYQESLLTQPEALFDFLTCQVRLLNLNEEETKIGDQIIGNIDEDGYLQATVEEIATATASTTDAVEKMILKIQELDPPGVGARNLQEALLIQLSRMAPEETILARKIVQFHLHILEKKDFPELAKILEAGPEQVKKAAELIARLEPRPGRTFYTGQSQTVIPDATVSFSEEEDGDLKIDMHDDAVPELRINPYYRRMLRNPQTDEKARNFVREKLQSALNFMRALQLRKSTLQEITEEIVKSQHDFFEKGFSHLKPLRLKDIAGNINIHESTVSRAIHGKYIVTPQGLIPYKSFFSSKLESTTGEAESQKSIMEKIRALVANENPKEPLSDQDILKILRSDGLVIARRTINKYRELLHIPPSHMRRQK